MEHGTNRINDTISRLRDFFSPRDRDMLCWTDISSVIDKSVALCQSQVKKMVQKVEILLPERLPKFYTDPCALEHIIINLILNAAYAADKEHSWLKLAVLRGENWQEGLVIEVQDNGCGIEIEDQKKIFEPFYTTLSADTSSGLGMFVCHNLTESLGGRIDLKSKAGFGTTIRVILPEIHH
jgi:polar amino acid transport system substrate-binding protein